MEIEKEMDTKNRVLMEACVGFFNNMNICYSHYDTEMRQIRNHFLNQLEFKIEANIRIHQLNLMNTIEMLRMEEGYTNNNHNENDNSTNTGRKTRKPRSIWMKQRDSSWWDSVRTGSDDAWTEVFSVNRETYYYLCQILYNELKPKPNAVRLSIPIETKIAAALYKLATNESYFNIGAKFGIHALSVQKAMFQFCESVTKILKAEYIAMPQSDEIVDVMQQFEDKIGLPQVIGVIEGTSITISNQAVGYSRHMVKHHTPDMILQGVIDTNCLFRDVALLLKPEDFTGYYAHIRKMMSEMPKKEIDGIPVPAYLISRREDAVHSCLMKPYVKVNTPEQELFNDYLSKSVPISEQTFKKLKGRWKILQEPLKVTVSFIPKVVKTCCILHNILEMRGMQYDSDSDSEICAYFEPKDVAEDSSDSGEAIRDHLKNYISAQFV